MKELVILGNSFEATSLALLAHQRGYAVAVSAVGSLTPAQKIELIAHQIHFDEGAPQPSRLATAHWVVTETALPEGILPLSCTTSTFSEAFLQLTTLPTVLIVGERGKRSTAHFLTAMLEQLGYRVGTVEATSPALASLYQSGKTYDLLLLTATSEQVGNPARFCPELLLWLNESAVPNAHFTHFLHALGGGTQLLYNADEEQIAHVVNRLVCTGRTLPFSHSFCYAGHIHLPTQTFLTAAGELEEITPAPLPLSAALIGKPLQINIVAACLAAQYFRIPAVLLHEVVRNGKGLPYRTQDVGTLHGVRFLNDAAASSEEATLEALQSTQGNVVWITQGALPDVSPRFCEVVRKHVKAIVTIGAANETLRRSLGELVYAIQHANDAYEATHLAYLLAEKGDSIVYSPLHTHAPAAALIALTGQQFAQAVELQVQVCEAQDILVHRSTKKRYA